MSTTQKIMLKYLRHSEKKNSKCLLLSYNCKLRYSGVNSVEFVASFFQELPALHVFYIWKFATQGRYKPTISRLKYSI